MTKENKKFTRRGILGIDTFIDKTDPEAEAKARQKKEDTVSKAKKKADKTLCACDFSQAEKEYRECLDISCKQSDTRRLMAYSMYKQGKYIQARVECVRLIKDHGPDESTATLLGLCHLRLGHGNKAIDLWTETEFSAESPIKKAIDANTKSIQKGDQTVIEKTATCIEENIPQLHGFDLLASVE